MFRGFSSKGGLEGGAGKDSGGGVLRLPFVVDGERGQHAISRGSKGAAGVVTICARKAWRFRKATLFGSEVESETGSKGAQVEQDAELSALLEYATSDCGLEE